MSNFDINYRMTSLLGCHSAYFKLSRYLSNSFLAPRILYARPAWRLSPPRPDEDLANLALFRTINLVYEIAFQHAPQFHMQIKDQDRVLKVMILVSIP